MISDRLRPYDETRELVVPHFLLRCPVPDRIWQGRIEIGCSAWRPGMA
jgi:hypothetical protein